MCVCVLDSLCFFQWACVGENVCFFLPNPSTALLSKFYAPFKLSLFIDSTVSMMYTVMLGAYIYIYAPSITVYI